MEFQILGPLEVRHRDVPVAPTGSRERRLLAVLLLSANRTVPLSRLVDGLWDHDPPPTARRQVQNRLSALRRRLRESGCPDNLVSADRSGYRLLAGPAQLDALRFQELLEKAQANPDGAGRAALLRTALALWRGPALVGLPGRLIEAAAVRLDEQRLAAYERCLDIELELGRHDDLIGELTELVTAHPLRERPVAQLMVALFRSTRQAEALGAYDRLRIRLAEELGIDPSEELRHLQLAILRDQVPPGAHIAAAGAAGADRTESSPVATGSGDRGGKTSPAGVVPRQLPAAPRHFVGRRDVLEALDRLAAAGCPAGTIVISLISGMAGVGKTATAVHWAHRAATRFPDGQLYVNLRGFDPSASPLHPAEAVRGFLDAFEVRTERIPAGLDAPAAMYRSLLAERRVLVLLDNASDADQVRPLLPGSPGCLVIVTSRSRLTSLVALEGATPTTLDLLTVGEARELLDRRLGAERVRAEPRAVDALITRCARLPLALAIVAAYASGQPSFPLSVPADQLDRAQHVRADGSAVADVADAVQDVVQDVVHHELAALGGGDPAIDVASVFSWSYRILDAGTARLFRLLGLHPGSGFGLPAVAALAGVPPSRARAALNELVQANLVTEQASDRYTLHDLLRAYAAELTHMEDAGEERRVALHRVLDHYLHSTYSAALVLYPHQDPIVLGPPHRGVTPENVTDPRQALAWLAAEHPTLMALLDVAGRHGFDTHAWQLAWSLSTFLDRHGHWLDQVASQEVALETTRRLGDRAAQARVHRVLARAYTRVERYDDARTQLRDALRRYGELGDQTGQAHTYHTLGWLDEFQDDHAAALGHSLRAHDLYQAVGDRSGVANTRNAVGWFHALLGNYPEALAWCGRALHLLQELGNRHAEAATLDSLGYAHHHLGDRQQALSCYQRAVELARELGDRYLEADALTHLGDTWQAAGDQSSARTAWREALAVLEPVGHPDADRLRARLAAAATGQPACY